mgnify:CR=1 FL=1
MLVLEVTIDSLRATNDLALSLLLCKVLGQQACICV